MKVKMKIKMYKCRVEYDVWIQADDEEDAVEKAQEFYGTWRSCEVIDQNELDTDEEMADEINDDRWLGI